MFPSVSPSHPSPYSRPLPPPQLYTNCPTESGPNSVLSLCSFSWFSFLSTTYSSLSDCSSQICANLWVLKSFSVPLSHSSTPHSTEDERSTHADRSRGRSVLTAGKSDWRGRKTEWETKSNMGMTSEPTVKANRGRQLSRGESQKWEKSLTLWVHDCLRDMPVCMLKTLHGTSHSRQICLMPHLESPSKSLPSLVHVF